MTFPTFKGPALAKIAIGVVAGMVVVAGGFMLVQNVFTKAADSAPRDLIISEITTNTAKLIWTTDQETQGVVEYGSSPTSLNLFAPESQKQKTHAVEITLLSPATSYYFQIRIGESKYDNGGVPWTFATKIQGAVASSPTASASSGTPLPTQADASLSPTSASAFGPLKGSTLKVNTNGVPTSPPVTPTRAPVVTSFYCVETDCQKICLKKNTGECSLLDFMKSGCVGKVNWVGCFGITPTPTWNPLTPTPTLTNTPTPSPTPTTVPGPTNPGYMN